MRLTVKNMDIATGGTLIAILNQNDAQRLDLHHEDRIVIRFRNRKTRAVIDIAETKKAVKPGYIGFFEEVMKKLNAKQGDKVEIDLEEKPVSVSYIRKKLDGERLSKEEIERIVMDLINNNLSAIEITYFISAVYCKGFDMEETTYLTKAMVKYGEQLKPEKHRIIDKHSSGGVPGNRTTMIIVPIVAAAGLVVPKTSSRAISSPAGTADTMEVLAPVDLGVAKMRRIVNKTNGCIVWGGAMNLAAADDKMIKIRHPLSLDPRGMLLASIMAKKTAVNSTHVLIDLPVGRSTKFKTIRCAKNLKKDFIRLGRNLGIKVKVIITDGKQPIGNGIGPALEARDVLYVLRNDSRAPDDLRDKSLGMAANMMQMAGMKNSTEKARIILESGLAYSKMQEIIKGQGGNPNIKPEQIRLGRFNHVVKASIPGKISCVDNKVVSKIARVAGAPKDKGAGIYLHKHVDDRIKKGEPIFTIYSESEQKLKYALKIMKMFDGIDVK